jgi:hypothetical protein
MNKKIIAMSLIGLCLLAASAGGQIPGDLNCNGFMDVSDFVKFLNFLNQPCDFQLGNECDRQNSDLDLDGMPMTIGDILISNSFSQHPDQDTILVESATGNPGDLLTLPVRITTADTILAFQFLLQADTNYIEFESITVHGLPFAAHFCDDYFYGTASNPDFYQNILLPGNHYIADITVKLKLHNEQPATTYIAFSSDPPRALYSGFANSAFFQPVMIDAEIQIVP